MKEHRVCHHKCWGLLIAGFGVFFLIANLLPATREIRQYWPIFLIAAGLLKAYCGHGICHK